MNDTYTLIYGKDGTTLASLIIMCAGSPRHGSVVDLSVVGTESELTFQGSAEEDWNALPKRALRNTAERPYASNNVKIIKALF